MYRDITVRPVIDRAVSLCRIADVRSVLRRRGNQQRLCRAESGIWRTGIALALVSALLIGAAPQATLAEPLWHESAHHVWNRTDRPVADGVVSRTWMWGPGAFTGALSEPYHESNGGTRQVQYFDKSRMEITHPDSDGRSMWYVTNGLLARELVTGQLQVGHTTFEARSPAVVNVAGDPGDGNGPTYATFSGLLGAAALAEGSVITQTLTRHGQVGDDASLGNFGVVAGPYVGETGHRVASVFWGFLTSGGVVYENGAYPWGALFENPFYATGLPISEAYWAQVAVGGVPKPVLVQVFERRVLTYTPENPAGWQVEAGNVGRHYYQWRYGQEPPVAAPPTQPAPPDAGNSGYSGTLSPGSVLPSTQDCALRVQRSSWEPRPQNAGANQTTGAGIAEINGANAVGNSRLAPRIDGNFTGTTDEIIQWASCKWGFDVDIVRAVAVQESWWVQSFYGDGGLSVGLLQVKSSVHAGTYPMASHSTAFNLDYALAWRRACFEGYFDHWIPGEARGDEWGCVGLWYSGSWKSGNHDYIASVQRHLAERTWQRADFQ
jgi:hypothetical protein